jgi:hypothetical protein
MTACVKTTAPTAAKTRLTFGRASTAMMEELGGYSKQVGNVEDEDWEKTSSRLRNAAMRRSNSRLTGRATRIDQATVIKRPPPLMSH